jgi:hypothetical protein
MSQRGFWLVVVLIFLLNGEIFSQENYFKKTGYAHSISVKSHLFATKCGYRNTPLNSTIIEAISSPIGTNYPFKLHPVSADYYCRGLGLICQSEWRFEKATKLPLRLRLGSLAYVDYMEGKK